MLAVLLAAALAVPQEPVRVSALLSNNRPIVGEPTMLRITVETRDTIPERIVDPVMPAGIDVVETQDYAETRISYPGGRNNVTERRLIIVARVPGQYTIPSAMVHASGRVWATRALPMTVTGGDGATINRNVDSRIDVVISPDTVFVGQQVLLEATAAFSRGLRSQQTRPATYTAPSPAGFWIHDVPEPLSVGMQTIDGELYETQTFRRVYFPLSPGTFRMPPARLQFELRRGFLSSAENFELVSDSPVIEVLPIPEADQPSSYRGAVGEYTVRATATPAQISVGEAATLVLEIEGTGNVKALPAPPFPAVPGMEVQPPTEDAETDARNGDVGGIKRFTWVLVPERPGRVTIPPIAYAYFNPDSKSFEVARTNALSLEVSGTAASGAASTTLAPLARAPSRVPHAIVRSPMFLAAQTIPLLILLIALRRRSSSAPSVAAARVERGRSDHFAALRNANAIDGTRFWPQFDAALRSAVADATGDPSLSRAPTTAIATALAKHGVAKATTSAILDLLRDAESARFAPGEAPRTPPRDCIERAERAIRSIERAHTGRANPLVMLAALMAVSLVPSTVAAAQSTPFSEGVSLYEEGDYAGAAAAFALYLEAHSGDANAWYDLGNARWSAGERGRAVHAWVRALRLEPRHDGARRNIESASGAAALTAMPPRYSLSTTQAAIVFSALWWLGILSCAVLALRRRSIAPAAVPALLLSVLAGIATLSGAAMRDAGVALEDTPLLMAPALKAEEIGAVPAGTVLEVVEQREGWTRVRVAGTEGWTESVVIGT